MVKWDLWFIGSGVSLKIPQESDGDFAGINYSPVKHQSARHTAAALLSFERKYGPSPACLLPSQCQPDCVPVCLSVCLPLSLAFCPSAHLSFCLSVGPFACMCSPDVIRSGLLGSKHQLSSLVCVIPSNNRYQLDDRFTICL